MIIETERLYLRELEQTDIESLSKILQDEQTMYAYEGAFDDGEVQNWLTKQIDNYQRDGFGLWAVILKQRNEMIGQCGLTWQDFSDQTVLEIGDLFQREFWHNGFATEAAKACKQYAFEQLNAQEVYSIIRDTNAASQKVAERNGMVRCGEFIKHYRGVDMPHYLYRVRK